MPPLRWTHFPPAPSIRFTRHKYIALHVQLCTCLLYGLTTIIWFIRCCYWFLPSFYVCTLSIFTSAMPRIWLGLKEDKVEWARDSLCFCPCSFHILLTSWWNVLVSVTDRESYLQLTTPAYSNGKFRKMAHTVIYLLFVLLCCCCCVLLLLLLMAVGDGWYFCIAFKCRLASSFCKYFTSFGKQSTCLIHLQLLTKTFTLANKFLMCFTLHSPPRPLSLSRALRPVTLLLAIQPRPLEE